MPDVPIEDVAGTIKAWSLQEKMHALGLSRPHRRASSAPRRAQVTAIQSSIFSRRHATSSRTASLAILRRTRHRVRPMGPTRCRLSHGDHQREDDVRRRGFPRLFAAIHRRGPGRQRRDGRPGQADRSSRSAPRLRRSLSPGCSRRRRSSCPSRGPRSCIAWRRIWVRSASRLTRDDLREIGQAAAQIQVQGARLPEAVLKLSYK